MLGRKLDIPGFVMATGYSSLEATHFNNVNVSK